MKSSLKFLPTLLFLNCGFSFACDDLEIPYTIEKTWRISSGEKGAPEGYLIKLPAVYSGLQFSVMSLISKDLAVPIATKLSMDGKNIEANIMVSLNMLENIKINAGYNLESFKQHNSELCEKYQDIEFDI